MEASGRPGTFETKLITSSYIGVSSWSTSMKNPFFLGDLPGIRQSLLSPKSQPHHTLLPGPLDYPS